MTVVGISFFQDKLSLFSKLTILKFKFYYFFSEFIKLLFFLFSLFLILNNNFKKLFDLLFCRADLGIVFVHNDSNFVFIFSFKLLIEVFSF